MITPVRTIRKAQKVLSQKVRTIRKDRMYVPIIPGPPREHPILIFPRKPIIGAYIHQNINSHKEN